MSNIALVKQPGVLREEMKNGIREHIEDYELLVFSEKNYTSLFDDTKLPEVIIVDFNLKIDTYRIIDHFLSREVKVIILVQYNYNDSQLLELFKLGLQGYFDYEMEMGELISAINWVLSGKHYIHPNLSPILLTDYIKSQGKRPSRPKGKLTGREWEVLELIVNGFENDDIGSQLFISPTTVTNHVSSILRKLDADNRTKAASIALKRRWVSL